MSIELWCKSNHSFLVGASFPEDLVHQAGRMGYEALAITDRDGVYGLPRAYDAKKSWPALKLISGAELTITDSSPLVLLARTRAAYGVLCRILTASHADQPKGEAKISIAGLAAFRDRPGFGELIALTETREDLGLVHELFQSQLSLLLVRALDGKDPERTDAVLQAASRFGLKIAASNRVLYTVREKRRLQDALTAIRHTTSVDEAGYRLESNDERYLKSESQLGQLFADIPEALSHARDLARSCTFCLSELKYTYPSEWIPEGQTAQSYLASLTEEGARERYPDGMPGAVRRQIEHELSLIAELGYADYFLTVYDIVRFARSRDILCQGRGSAANSVICYCLGITAIDPVRMNLLFERFISRERGEPPDIDVDFEHERREEVLQYIYARYGRHRAAMVAAVIKYQGRNSILDLAKALGAEVGTKQALEVHRDFERLAGKKAGRRALLDELIQEIDGFPRHLSIHSGGFTLSATDLCEIVPIEPARMPGRTIVQWDKNDLDLLGLLKIDCLSLGALTALHQVLKGLNLKLTDIPAEDKATYRMIQEGATEGTFQIESRAQKASIVRTLPENFGDLVIQVAIVRPGPTVGEMVHPYINRRAMSRRGVPYRLPDPRLEPILGRTFGVPVFQEQIMKIAIDFAGFSPGEADQLRRAIAAWRSAGSVDSLGERLRQGLLANGVPQGYAEELFSYLKGFSEYGFPESHAASFALIAYATAYLKCHHPAEFLCALINAQPMGFYPIDTLIHEAQRRGVTVLDLSPHHSDWDATIEAPKTVRMGLRSVRGIRKDAVEALLKARSESPFTSFRDFLIRTDLSDDILERLALANTFACFGLDQRHTLWSQLRETPLLASAKASQLSLFEQDDGSAKESHRALLFRKLSAYEETIADFQAKDFSVRGDLMKLLREQNPALPRATSASVKAQRDGSRVHFAGIVLVIQRPPPAKGVCFITLEDETGTLDLIVWPKVYERYRAVIRESRFMTIRGSLQKKGASLSVIASGFEGFQPDSSRAAMRTPGGHPREARKIF